MDDSLVELPELHYLARRIEPISEMDAPAVVRAALVIGNGANGTVMQIGWLAKTTVASRSCRGTATSKSF